MTDPFAGVKGVPAQDRIKVPDKLQDPIPMKVMVEKPKTKPTQGTKKPAPRKSVSLETRIAAQLVSLNFFVLLTPWREDALDPEEIKALAHAINSQAQASATFRKTIEFALAAGSSGELIGVVMMIVIKRAANHGMVPEMFADMAAGLMPNIGDDNGEESNPEA